MADVYLARQIGPYGFSKRVAVKVLKSEIAREDENVRMFVREALVAAEFRHPNLAQVYEIGEVNGQLFIAMELIRGLSVAALMRELTARHREMPRNVAVRIAIDTLDGLAHAHEGRGIDGRPLGLVHRDVSPQNVLVSVDGAVKIVDFGIARAAALSGRTQESKIKGKFSYMAPEQWTPESELDARADLFSVGVLLYEMTTGGRRLFQGETPRDLYKAAVLDPIPDPRTRDPSYPAALARIVMRALERGPTARWPSARAMRTALVEFAQGENWSLTQRAVADAFRSARGSADVEATWEPVAGADLGAPDESLPVVRASDGSQQDDVPTRSGPSRPPRPVGALRRAVLVAGAVGLVVGLASGFGLGRCASSRSLGHRGTDGR